MPIPIKRDSQCYCSQKRHSRINHWKDKRRTTELSSVSLTQNIYMRWKGATIINQICFVNYIYNNVIIHNECCLFIEVTESITNRCWHSGHSCYACWLGTFSVPFCIMWQQSISKLCSLIACQPAVKKKKNSHMTEPAFLALLFSLFRDSWFIWFCYRANSRAHRNFLKVCRHLYVMYISDLVNWVNLLFSWIKILTDI